jgi:hypothetical protein
MTPLRMALEAAVLIVFLTGFVVLAAMGVGL